jgi:hypothetical protein
MQNNDNGCVDQFRKRLIITSRQIAEKAGRLQCSP